MAFALALGGWGRAMDARRGEWHTCVLAPGHPGDGPAAEASFLAGA